MKRFLSFLAISTIALTMASCGGDSNAPALKNFKVQVKDLTETSLTLEIEALIPDKYFCFDFVTEEAFKKNGADFYFKKAIEQIEVYHMLPEELFSKNKVSVPYQIEQGTDYVLCLFYVTDDLELDGEIEHTIISTITGKFQVSFSNIQPNTATVTIVPRDQNMRYIVDALPQKMYEVLKDDLESDIKNETFKDGVFTGTQTIPLNQLDPGTLYAFLVAEIDENGKAVGDIEIYTFTTADVEIISTMSLALSGNVMYSQDMGLFLIVAIKNGFGISLIVASSDLEATYTEKDLFEDGEMYSYVGTSEKDNSKIVKAEFSGKKISDMAYTYIGWVVCADGTRYDINLTCVVGAPQD